MAKILAIDYGTKRTGLAVTDDMQIIASGLTTIDTKSIFTFLTHFFATEKVLEVVIGQAKQLNGLPSESSPFIEGFVAQFSKTFPDKKIIRIDERFTSKMAVQTMIASGLKKKQRQNKALLDEISATILLQDYLSSKAI